MTSLERLVAEFTESVLSQENAIGMGNHRSENRHAKAYIAAFGKLREYGDRGREALATLLSDPRDAVRAMAAAFLLRHRTADAQAVLVNVARGTGMVTFGAAEALRRWREGSWSLDPGDDPTD